MTAFVFMTREEAPAASVVIYLQDMGWNNHTPQGGNYRQKAGIVMPSSDRNSYFDGSVAQLIGYSILSYLLTAATFGIAYPWALCMLQRWEAEHTVADEHRLIFDGKGAQFFGLWFLLSVIPYGVLIVASGVVLMAAKDGSVGTLILIYLFLIIVALCYACFVRVRVKKWIISHTHFKCMPAYAYSSPDPASPPAVNSSYAPGQSVRPARSAEPGLFDKLIPVNSVREKALPIVLSVLSFAVTLSVLVFLFA